ncbi:PLP-dependent aminotransferase family protein [Alcaligenaceae bacterium]|nr:PLP-dependent aminotransferase family protein [Alcaligenaceae bacterium]
MIYFQASRDRSTGPSLVDQAVQAVEHAIRSQVLRPGMAVPSVRLFAKTHGLSTFTVSAAYNRLVAQGWLVARPGSGYRVVLRARAEPPVSAPPNWSPPRVSASWLLSDVFADHSIPIKSGCGWLPPEWLNETGLEQAMRQAARVPASQVGGYGHPYGYHPLREHLTQELAQHGLNIDIKQVLLTQGATQGLDIVARTLFRPGDIVAVELPGYANLLQTLRLAGLTVVGVARNADGVCVQSLQALASAHPFKALFLNTVLQNPTGTSLSIANAFRVLQLAEQHDFLVIEDDVSRDLMPDIGPLLAAMAGSERVVYVSGFSKTIAPSMRVGYIVSTPALLEEFAKTKMTIGLTTPEIMERTVYQVLRLGRHRPYLQRVQDRLRQAHDELADLMDQHGFEVYSRPRAGLFMWARPQGKWRERGTARLAELALKDGIWLAPGFYFYPDQVDDGWIRFNVAYSLHPALWEFMRRVGAASIVE